MSRPSRGTDLLLIKAALKLLPGSGFSSLKMRAVAKEAGVNLGMFHYHFKNKDEFTERVLENMYEEFFTKFKGDVSSCDDAETKLRTAIRFIAGFVAHNRTLIQSLIKDAMNGNREVIKFLSANLPRHVGIMVDALDDYKKAGKIGAMRQEEALMFLMLSVIGPIFMSRVLNFLGVLDNRKEKGVINAGEPAAIATRIDIALDAISKKGRVEK